MSSYNNLFITTAEIERISIFNLPMDYEVRCCRSAGWELRRRVGDGYRLVAAEYEYPDRGLRLDVSGIVIVDSLSRSHRRSG